jgi:hypothetical protein
VRGNRGTLHPDLLITNHSMFKNTWRFLIVNEELKKIEQMAEAASEESASLLDNLLRVARMVWLGGRELRPG